MAHFIIKQNLWPQWNFIMSLTEQNTKPLKYFKQSKVQVYHTGYSCHPFFFFSCYSYERKWCFCDSYVKKKMKWTEEIFSTFEPDCLSVWILHRLFSQCLLICPFLPLFWFRLRLPSNTQMKMDGRTPKTT